MQSLSMYTRTDIAFGLLAICPIEVEIDLRQLVLFGQLCRLNSNFWAKIMFLNRLTSFKINPRIQTGFIVEINRLLQKYNLEHILDAYLNDGVFPRKFAWNIIIKTHENAKLSWHERVSNPELNRFSKLHSNFNPHWAWRFSKMNRKMLKPCISVVKLLSSVSSLSFLDNICCHCQRFRSLYT